MTETPTDSARAHDEAVDPTDSTGSVPVAATSTDGAVDAPADAPADAPSDQAAEADDTAPEGADDAAPDAADDAASEETGDAGETSEAPEPAPGTGSGERSRSATPTPERLEEEGDVAADYLEELLDIVDLDGDIDIDVENGRASVSVVADAGSERSLRRLVGEEGVALEALQELTRLAVQARTGERTRLMLDVAGYRAARRAELEKLAGQAIERVRSDGQAVSLDPMSPFERKVVHDAVAAAGLRSESEGEDSGRHVIVLPAGA